MIVLDASAWVDVLTGVISPPDPDEPVVVPPHFDAEVVGSLRALQQRAVISAEDADRALDQHLRARFSAEWTEADIRQAWRWRDSMSVADGWYAAMALRLNATWVTTDQRAGATARRHGVTTHCPG
ncbi:type II toxin-antitoxin system VapC family toxin [Ornithinimicrobium sp. F0845]|uniref:type II toxin-antitoxin system VapC family toxin n=1 Tax=Ornithinimicrobium sp. F0845 TaxID=2926412 RepID=UPI001FF6807C|nr:type II toxin-antitoxin system VapC family toxin [Ornithinimicrobium sp. F0845]MCK0112627.1 type II toxin-antitoxin system VapC family toxin [Ornithinimicrobium sp. F0845]